MPADVDVTIQGAEELRRTLKRAADQVSDMTGTNQQAASRLGAAASARAPRRTGALAGSMRATATPTQARVEFPIVYANPIHWGWPARNIRSNPFATTALEQTQAVTVGLYEKRVDQIVGGIRGA